MRGYFPGLAANNHYLAWFKCFDKLGINATVVTVRPNNDFDRIPNIYKNIDIINLWEKSFIKTKIRWVRFIQHMHNIIKFEKMVQKGDVIWVYDLPEALPFLVRKKGVRVYNEITEYPQMIRKNSFTNYLLKRRLDNIRHLSGLFVISTYLKTYFIEKGVDEAKIKIINMIVDSDRFLGLKRNSTVPYIAFCGNGTNNKDGVDLLIKSFALVHKSHPEYYLYIIGENPSPGDMSGNYELIESLRIKNNVVLLGKKNPKEVPQLLKDAKILALARPQSLQAQNGFPTKLGEYLLTENPVCVTDVGDIPLFLKDGISGMIAKHDDIDDFAQKLNWVIEHEDEAKKIGIAGATVALTKFNPMTEAKKMLVHMGFKKGHQKIYSD